MTNIEKSILSTVVYYNAFNLPLTSWEIFEYLLIPLALRKSFVERCSFEDVFDALESENLEKFLDKKNGFYFLRGKLFLYERRMNRQKISDFKWKKFIKIIKWFSVAPFIKIVCANGSLAANNTDEKSDLDVFIIARSERIWTARLFLAALTALMGVKRFNKSKNINNKICFNHFVTDKSMHIPFHSIYTANNFARLESVFCSDKNKDNFSEFPDGFYKNNDWIKEYLPNFKGEIKNNHRIAVGLLSFVGRTNGWLLGGWVGRLLESFLKKYQLRRIRTGINGNNIQGRIVVDDNQLEFHPYSSEKKVIDNYNKKIFELGFSELADEKDSGLGSLFL